jgi:hypothetical protein
MGIIEKGFAFKTGMDRGLYFFVLKKVHVMPCHPVKCSGQIPQGIIAVKGHFFLLNIDGG